MFVSCLAWKEEQGACHSRGSSRSRYPFVIRETPAAMTDFFISYTQDDRGWGEWIAWVLEAAGFSTKIQAWDFGAGTNFIVEMHQASAEAERTIAVLSPEY